MRKETITRELYTFEELSDAAKEKARNWFREGALDYDWWEYLYEDAAAIGLKITTFDLDRHRHAKGNLTKSVEDVCKLIMENHGKTCDTYELAMESKDIDEEDEEAVKEFERALLEEYSIMLQHEYEYRLSDEAVDED